MVYWSIGCAGAGTHNYKAGFKMYASGIGYWSAEIRSSNSIKEGGGTSAP
jgi:hypothetical protein